MAEYRSPAWTFLTNHAQVLVCIAQDPGIRLREISERVGITERAVHRIVAWSQLVHEDDGVPDPH
jgi:DNA-binding MarR family transcriptional regulator